MNEPQINPEWIDSIRKENIQLRNMVEWARTLLCSATPNSKFLDEEQQQAWAVGFGKWFAQSHDIKHHDVL